MIRTLEPSEVERPKFRKEHQVKAYAEYIAQLTLGGVISPNVAKACLEAVRTAMHASELAIEERLAELQRIIAERGYIDGIGE